MNMQWVPDVMPWPSPEDGQVAVVLVSDRNYLLPTFSTALSADAHISRSDVPIYIFVVDAEEAWLSQFDQAIAHTKIRLLPAVLPDFGDLAAFHRDNYLPPITLARFWIGSLLEPGIDRFLYLDGDTMVDGELDSLLAIRPPETGLMVVAEFARIYIDEIGYGKWRDVRYLEDIGCEPDFYFNAGVIYAARQAWDAITPAATRFLREKPELCIASDQTALNHAARGNVTLLPLRYNYQSDHMMVLDPRKIERKATIWHFVGAPKPWNAPGWPWDAYFNRYYVQAEARLRGFDVATPVPPEKQVLAGLAHRRRTRTRLDWVYPWRKLNRRRKIRPMLAEL